MKNLHFHGQSALAPLFLLAIWAVAIFLVNPIGDFPLNDDFSYGKTVFNLTEKKMLLFDDWFAMTLIGQVLWGAAFCKIAGFSFTVLRISTLVAALLGLFSFYKIGRELDQPASVCILATLLIGFNPLFFSLSFTFMSDVPFACAIIVSVLFYLKYFKTYLTKWLILATFFALLATFIRQLGLMLPVAFTAVWLILGRMDWKRLMTGILPLAISVAALAIYQKWFDSALGLPDSYGQASKLFTRLSHDTFLKGCLERLGMLLIYLGLLLFPINIALLKKPVYRQQVMVLTAVIAFSLWSMFSIWHRFPWGNILYNIGLGPKLLKDGQFFLNIHPALSTLGIRSLAFLGIVGGIMLAANLLQVLFDKKIEPSPTKAIRLFALANIFLYGAFLMVDYHFFDRYFIPLLPFGLIFFMTLRFDAFLKWPRKAGVALTFAILLLFSISATHDYLSWNRARWEALDFLTKEKGITPNQIDGGFEFNGWHRPIPERIFYSQKSWWWVDREDFVVSFGDLNGFKKINAFPFKTYLTPGVDSVFVLEKMQ